MYSTGPKIPSYTVAVLATLVAGLLCLQLISRFHYQKAYVAFRQGDLALADAQLALSAGVGAQLFPGDRKRLANLAGDLALEQTQQAQNTTEVLEKAEKAERFYQTAFTIAPNDLDTNMGLAQSVGLLERLYPFVLKQSYPQQALPIYERLLELMPVNLYTFELLTRYYLSRQMTDKLDSLVMENVKLWPPLYFQLKRQSFYSPTMNDGLKAALLKAKNSDVYARDAARALADLAAIEGDYTRAIDYYREARPEYIFRDISDYYLGLGRLYLKAKLFSEASNAFLQSLETKEREDRLLSVYGSYRAEKLYEPFLLLALRVEQQWPQLERILLLKAECYLALEQYELALSQLIRLQLPRLLPESYYLQAKIAEQQGDVDLMELRSQRATVLDPTDFRYHLLFSQALKKQGKIIGAEQAATAAIDASGGKNPWLYNHRAWLRWTLKNYSGAQDDWVKAIHLSPLTASFYVSLARVFEQGGNISAAISNLEKALTLPGDATSIRKKLLELRTLPGKGEQ